MAGIGKKCVEWLEMVGNYWKWIEMANLLEWLNIAGNGLKWLKRAGHGWNGWKRQKKAANAGNSYKWLELPDGLKWLIMA